MKAKKTGFNFDDEELLLSLMISDSWPVMMRFMEQLQDEFNQRVLQFNLSDGADKLLLEKARIEGSLRMISELKKYRELRVRDAQKANALASKK